LIEDKGGFLCIVVDGDDSPPGEKATAGVVCCVAVYVAVNISKVRDRPVQLDLEATRVLGDVCALAIEGILHFLGVVSDPSFPAPLELLVEACEVVPAILDLAAEFEKPWHSGDIRAGANADFARSKRHSKCKCNRSDNRFHLTIIIIIN
jgi:hypothetical protein